MMRGAALALLVAAVVVLGAVPVLAPPYYASLLIPFFGYAIALLGFNLLFGYAGLLSFGHAMFLGLGGFLRERAVGTVDYTLSLPVSRTRWFLYRSLNGALQSMGAALVPALSVPVIAALSGGDFPVGDAFLLGLRLGLGGMLFYSIGLLASVLFAGDFTSAGIGIALVFAVNNSTRVIESFKGLSLQDAIFPMPTKDEYTYLIRGHMPWGGIALSCALSLVLSACAWKVTRERDF
jgi:ABC-type branched-subunit amino acid transport system permease subunit